MRLIRLNLKIIFSSVILYLFYAFIVLFFLFFLVMMNQTRFINYAIFFDSLAYLEIAVFILAFCLAVYFAHQGYALEEACFVSKPACLLSRLSAVLIASGCVCAVPLIYIAAASVSEGTELYFCGLAAAYFLLRWLSLILVSQSMGFLMRFLLKKTFVYLLAAPFAIIFSHLNGSFLSIFFNADRMTVVSNLLSLQKPLIFGVDIDYAGPSVDLLFAVKCALVLLFTLFIAAATVAAGYLYRYVRLFIVLFVPHAAAVAVMFDKVNASISEYLTAFPEYAPFPAVNILIPLTHCAVALNFYVAMTLFLMLLFKDAVIPVVLIMAWCALEAGPLNIIFQRYDIFAGAFGHRIFTAIFPQTSCGC